MLQFGLAIGLLAIGLAACSEGGFPELGERHNDGTGGSGGESGGNGASGSSGAGGSPATPPPGHCDGDDPAPAKYVSVNDLGQLANEDPYTGYESFPVNASGDVFFHSRANNLTQFGGKPDLSQNNIYTRNYFSGPTQLLSQKVGGFAPVNAGPLTAFLTKHPVSGHIRLYGTFSKNGEPFEILPKAWIIYGHDEFDIGFFSVAQTGPHQYVLAAEVRGSQDGTSIGEFNSIVLIKAEEENGVFQKLTYFDILNSGTGLSGYQPVFSPSGRFLVWWSSEEKYGTNIFPEQAGNYHLMRLDLAELPLVAPTAYPPEKVGVQPEILQKGMRYIQPATISDQGDVAFAEQKTSCENNGPCSPAVPRIRLYTKSNPNGESIPNATNPAFPADGSQLIYQKSVPGDAAHPFRDWIVRRNLFNGIEEYLSNPDTKGRCDVAPAVDPTGHFVSWSHYAGAENGYQLVVLDLKK